MDNKVRDVKREVDMHLPPPVSVTKRQSYLDFGAKSQIPEGAGAYPKAGKTKKKIFSFNYVSAPFRMYASAIKTQLNPNIP